MFLKNLEDINSLEDDELINLSLTFVFSTKYLNELEIKAKNNYFGKTKWLSIYIF